MALIGSNNSDGVGHLSNAPFIDQSDRYFPLRLRMVIAGNGRITQVNATIWAGEMRAQNDNMRANEREEA